MMKKLLISIYMILAFAIPLLADDIQGFWKTIDDKTGKQQSVVAIYEFQGKYFGRVIGSYDENNYLYDNIYSPKTQAYAVPGSPYYSGLDIIWNIQKQGNKYKGGSVLDPEHGKVYDAEMWLDNGNLIVRGEILFFGRNVKWLAATDADFPRGFKKPDLTAMTPSIPQIR
jgi:uncharacterized protein (DUF2147 family)